jgi:hypothetical protein
MSLCKINLLKNVKRVMGLMTVTGIFAMTCFSVTAMAKGSSAAMAKTTTTTTETTTELTTEDTTEATTETVETTEVTTAEVYTNADGTPMTDEEINIYKIVKATPDTYKTGAVKVEPVDTFNEYTDYIESNRTFNFLNGDVYSITRYEFKQNDLGQTSPLAKNFEIPGNSIEIRYIGDDGNWYMTTNLQSVPQKTLFIDTDLCSLALSVPAVYKDSYVNNTLEVIPEMESGVTITKTETGYSIAYSYPGAYGTIGELWYLYSQNKLADWNNANHFSVLNTDLSSKHRISFDGYYYPTPYNYEPCGDNVFYRQPSDYVGSQFVNFGDFPAANELGYVLTYTCMKNQNVQGYWATGPKSGWLAADFNIGTGFYDTRFNTDFACSLLKAYQRYGNEEFLTAAVRYAEYFKKHVQNNSYQTLYGGYLVSDYGSFDGNHIKTHVSLNHQLAEMNYLYQLYDITREESYLLLADKMLQAIEDTRDQWVLADNNLNYALHYTGTYNTMKDYPYLTYNDLFNTKTILNTCFNRSSETIDYLMSCKMQWMQANNVTGYKTN